MRVNVAPRSAPRRVMSSAAPACSCVAVCVVSTNACLRLAPSLLPCPLTLPPPSSLPARLPAPAACPASVPCSGQARLVMRQKGNLRLLMNANLWGEMQVSKMEGGKVSEGGCGVLCCAVQKGEPSPGRSL